MKPAQLNDNKPGYTPLSCAVSQGNIDSIKLLLAHGARLSTSWFQDRTTWFSKDKAVATGSTYLHLAASRGRTKASDFLIAKGLDVNAKTDSENTSLHSAAENGHLDTVKLLIAKGAKIDVRTVRTSPPLHRAVKNEHAEIVKILLEKGADVNVCSSVYPSSLFLCARNKNTRIARLLIAKGADVNKPWKRGAFTLINYPLHIAVGKGDITMVKLLINNGANVNVKDTHGRTPLYWAKENREIVKILKAHGAK